MFSDHPRTYQITVQGECGTLLATVLGRVKDITCRAGRTRVVVSIRDQSELWGLLDRLQDLALRIVSLYELRNGGPDDAEGLEGPGETALQPHGNPGARRE